MMALSGLFAFPFFIQKIYVILILRLARLTIVARPTVGERKRNHHYTKLTEGQANNLTEPRGRPKQTGNVSLFLPFKEFFWPRETVGRWQWFYVENSVVLGLGEEIRWLALFGCWRDDGGWGVWQANHITKRQPEHRWPRQFSGIRASKYDCCCRRRYQHQHDRMGGGVSNGYNPIQSTLRSSNHCSKTKGKFYRCSRQEEAKISSRFQKGRILMCQVNDYCSVERLPVREITTKRDY